MSPNIGNFDANQVEPNKAFDPIPPGWYAMQVIGSEVRQSKTSDGQYVWLELEVLEQVHPELKGRRAWERLNLWNQNEKAVDIAQRTLSAICRATGQMVVQETEALHHKPLAVKIKVRPASGQYEAANDISGYDSIASRFPAGTPAAAPAAAAPQQPAQAATPTATAPINPQPAQPPSGAPPWQQPNG